MKKIAEGAEASIYKSGNFIIKKRIEKKYRHPELDFKIISKRTRAESKIIEKVSKIINVPILLKSEDSEIHLSNINGINLSSVLDKLNSKEFKLVCKQIGSNIAKIHNLGIIHGDLTTSNMIYNKKDKKVYFIDFGLSFHSNRIEDKAVDLHLIKQALEAKHSKIYREAFDEIISTYSKESSHPKEIVKRLSVVESRGRYKRQY